MDYADLLAAIATEFERAEVRHNERHQALLEALAVRFDAIDHRFEEEHQHFTARFDAVDRRFDRERSLVAGQFEVMQKRMDEGFADIKQAIDVVLGTQVRNRRRRGEQ